MGDRTVPLDDDTRNSSPSGRKVLAEVRRIVHDHERDWMRGFSDRELSSLIGALHRIQLTLSDGETSR